MQLVREHHVRIESNFTNLVMGIVVLEGLGRQLDENLDIFQTALPILKHAHEDYRSQARTCVCCRSLHPRAHAPTRLRC